MTISTNIIHATATQAPLATLQAPYRFCWQGRSLVFFQGRPVVAPAVRRMA